MFAPTKTWRKWHRKINISQKRYAVASALAASAIPALVMARGHVIDQVPEIPLVVETTLESTKKTSAAKDILAAIGAMDDVDKAADSKQIRSGKGKMRNRRYTLRRGPLIVYANNDGVEQAFRNLPGVELCCVTRLNLLQLAPGGHMGRFCIWSRAALEALDTIYGEGEGGKRIPAASMTNADLARIINSDEIQSILNPASTEMPKYPRKANPLKNMDALEKLDPYAAEARRASARAQAARVGKKADLLKKKREAAVLKKPFKAQGKAFYKQASEQGSVCENGFEIS
jgi:large subunit ribosomal protein L4e